MAEKTKKVVVKVTSTGLKPLLKDLKQLNSHAKGTKKIKLEVNRTHFKSSVTQAIASLSKAGGARALKINATINKTLFRSSMLSQIRLLEKRGINLRANVRQGSNTTNANSNSNIRQGASLGTNLGAASGAGLQKDTTRGIQASIRAFDGMDKIFRKMNNTFRKQDRQMNLLNRNMETLTRGVADLVGALVGPASKARILRQVAVGRVNREAIHAGSGYWMPGKDGKGGMQVDRKTWQAHREKDAGVIRSRALEKSWGGQQAIDAERTRLYGRPSGKSSGIGAVTKEHTAALKQNTNVIKSNTVATKSTSAKATYGRNRAVAGNVNRGAKGFSLMAQAEGGASNSLVGMYADVAAKVFAIGAAFRALKEAADLTVLKDSMTAYGSATNVNLTQISENLQKAVDHTVDFKQAAQTTTLATAAGFNADQIEKMGAAAKMAALALGRDMGDALDRLTRGVVKAEPEVLDELGIILRLEPATKKYAEAIGKTVKDLTTFEKSQAVLNEVLTQTERKFGKVGDSVAANPYGKLQAQVTEMALELGGLLNLVINPLIEGILKVPQLLIVAFAGLVTFLGKSIFAGAFSKVFATGTESGTDTIGREALAEKKGMQQATRARVAREKAAGRNASIVRRTDSNKLWDIETREPLQRYTRIDHRRRNELGQYRKNTKQENIQAWANSKKEDFKEFGATNAEFMAKSSGDLSGSKHKFTKLRNNGVGTFKAFDRARKSMIRNMNDSFEATFGKGGKVSKSLLNFNKTTKTATLAMYAFGGAIKKAILGAVGAFMILPAIVQMFSSLGKGMGLVTVSNDEYTDSTKSLTDAVSDQQAELARVGDAYSMMASADYFEQMIGSSELFANSLSNTDQALSSNIQSLEKFIAQATGVSKVWSGFLGIFYQSVFDDSVTSLDNAINSANRLGMSLEDLGITQEQVNNATSKWNGDERQTLALLRKVKKPMEDRTRSARNYANALKEIKQAGADLTKEWKTMAGKLPTTPIDGLLTQLTKGAKGVKTAGEEFDKQFKDWNIQGKLGDGFNTIDNSYVADNPDSYFASDPVKNAMDALSSLKGIITPENKDEVTKKIEGMYEDFYTNNIPDIQEKYYKIYKKQLATDANIPVIDDIWNAIMIAPSATGLFDAPGTEEGVRKSFAKMLSMDFLEGQTLEGLAVGTALEPFKELEATLESIASKKGMQDLGLGAADFALEQAESWEEAESSLAKMSKYAALVQKGFIVAAGKAAEMSRNASVLITGSSSTNVIAGLTLENSSLTKQVSLIELELKVREGIISTMAESVEKQQMILSKELLSNKQTQLELKLKSEVGILLEGDNKTLKRKLDLETQSLEATRAKAEAQASLGKITTQQLNNAQAQAKTDSNQQDYMSKVSAKAMEFIKFQDKINATALSKESKTTAITAEASEINTELAAYKTLKGIKQDTINMELQAANLADKKSKIEDIVSHTTTLRDLYGEIYTFGALATDSEKASFELSQRAAELKTEKLSIEKQIELSNGVSATHQTLELTRQQEINALKTEQLRIEKKYLSIYVDLEAMRAGQLDNEEKRLSILDKEFKMRKTLITFSRKQDKEALVYNAKYLSNSQKILNVGHKIAKVGLDNNSATQLLVEFNGLLLDQDILRLENQERILANLKEQHEIRKSTMRDKVFSGEEFSDTFSDEMHYRFKEFNDDFRDTVTFAADLWGTAFLDPIDRMAENLKGDKGLYGDGGFNEFWNDTWRGLGDQFIDQGASQIKMAMMSDFDKNKVAQAEALAGMQEDRARKDSANLQSTASLLAGIKYNTDPKNFNVRHPDTDIAAFAVSADKMSVTFSEAVVEFGKWVGSLPTHLNGIEKRASGGHISGPGGPREDKIPAWLSNGEYVINAASTKKHQGLIEAINEDRVPKLKNGGIAKFEKGAKVTNSDKTNSKAARAIFDGRFSKGLNLSHFPADKWGPGEVSGTKNGIRGSISYRLDGTKVSAISVRAPAGGPNSLQLLDKLLKSNPSITQIDPFETSVGSKFTDKKGYGINKHVGGGTQALNSWRALAGLHGVEVLETISEMEARGAYGKGNHLGAAKTGAPFLAGDPYSSNKKIGVHERSTGRGRFVSPKDAYDSKYIRGANPKGAPSAGSIKIYDMLMSGKDPYKGTRIATGGPYSGLVAQAVRGTKLAKGRAMERRIWNKGLASRVGGTLIGLPFAGGMAIAELINMIFGNPFVDEPTSVMEGFSKGGRATSSINNNYKKVWGIDKDANSDNIDKWSTFAGGAGLAKVAEFIANMKGMGQGWLPNGAFEKLNPGMKGSAGNWWKAGSNSFGLKGSFMGAKPTMGGTLGLAGLAGWGGFELGRLLSPSADSYWDEEEKNGYARTKSMFGFASGGLASRGRKGDTELAHVNKGEKALLRALGGSATRNPSTGLVEYAGGDVGNLTTGLQDISNILNRMFQGQKVTVMELKAVKSSTADYYKRVDNGFKELKLPLESLGVNTSHLASLWALAKDGVIDETERKALSNDQLTSLTNIEEILGTSLGEQRKGLAVTEAGDSGFLNEAASLGWSQDQSNEFLAKYSNINGTRIIDEKAENTAALQAQMRVFDMNNSKWGKTFSEFGIEMSEVHNIASGAMKMAIGQALRTGKFEWKSMLSTIAGSIGNKLLDAAAGAATKGLMSWMGFANGGTVSGGFKAFASGGTVTKPTLGLVGEGKYNEAVVPLPDGKSIPVIQSTPPGVSGASTNNVSVTINMEQGTAKSGSSSNKDNGADIGALGDMIAGQIQQVLLDEKRPGGILSEI